MLLFTLIKLIKIFKMAAELYRGALKCKQNVSVYHSDLPSLPIKLKMLPGEAELVSE